MPSSRNARCHCCSPSIDADPYTVTVITIAVSGIPPAVLFRLAPCPIVVVYVEPEARIVVAALFHAPAIAFVIADNGGRCCRSAYASADAHAKAVRSFMIISVVMASRGVGLQRSASGTVHAAAYWIGACVGRSSVIGLGVGSVVGAGDGAGVPVFAPGRFS